MNAEQLIFAANKSAYDARDLCLNLWRELPLKEAPALDPHKCAQLAEAARHLSCAANALQLLSHGVKPPKHGD